MRRYIRVRYEDLVSKTNIKLRQIYSFLGLPYSRQVERAVSVHTGVPPGPKNRNKFSTFRSKSFNPNTWKKDLTVNKIQEIEKDCEEFMKLTGYQKFA